MKKYQAWQWEDKGRTLFYAIDLKGQKISRAWGKVGSVAETRILDLKYPNEGEAWANFKTLRLEAEQKEGKVETSSSAKKLFGEDVPVLLLGQIHEIKDYPEGAFEGCFTSAIPSFVPTKMVDQEDENLLLIKHKKDNQLAEEFQQDLAFHKRIYGESEEYYSNLLRFYVFLEKRQK